MSSLRNTFGETGGRLRMHTSQTEGALPRLVGGCVLYLDLGGALHPEDVWRSTKGVPYVRSPPGHEVLEHASQLEQVLDPFPDVRIVLSTSWVQALKSVSRVARRLPEELRVRVVGATYHSRMPADVFAEMPRVMQIVTDVRRRQPTEWLALDDDIRGCPVWCRERFVHTDQSLGISAPHVLEELRSKLRTTFGVDAQSS
jgi:hypothetical protein